jgi:hypothetical protein
MVAALPSTGVASRHGVDMAQLSDPTPNRAKRHAGVIAKRHAGVIAKRHAGVIAKRHAGAIVNRRTPVMAAIALAVLLGTSACDGSEAGRGRSREIAAYLALIISAVISRR